MPKQIAVDLADPVYDAFEQFGLSRGLTPVEALKWLVGDFLYHNSGFLTQSPVRVGSPSLAFSPPPTNPGSDAIVNMARLMLQDYITSKDPKCPHCSQSLTIKGIEHNECEGCHKKLV